MPGSIVAAIDCGTNSTRLLVSDGRGGTLDRLMRITRLGRGTGSSGMLDENAIERTLEVLREYREVIDRHGAEQVRIAATSASRDARNRDDFFDAAEAIVGVRPELLTGAEEGELSFLGATSDLDPSTGPFLVVDIGGGSTELSFGSVPPRSGAAHAGMRTPVMLAGTVSCDIGCVRLTEQFLLHDPPLPEELLQCLSITELHLHDAAGEIPGITGARTFVGLAGTVTTAAAVEIGLETYDRDAIHHFELTKAAAEDVFRTLATESFDERIENPGLEKERADVIVGGMCILVEIMRFFGFGTCLVSEADILDGLAMSIS